jgi:hypothetical protein
MLGPREARLSTILRQEDAALVVLGEAHCL